MLKFKKVLNSNIISLIIAVVFFLNNTAYGIGADTEFHLRAPVGEVATYRRLKETQDFLAPSIAVPEQQALSQKINLIYLISLLKELSKANYDNQYYINLITNPERLSQMAQDFKGKPQRVDTLINLQSSYGYQAGIELIANAIDAIVIENGILPTGRFGIGAYQCLAALEEDGDYVSWTTSKDGKLGLRIIVTKGDNGQYFYQCQTLTQGVRKGTLVKIFKQKYPHDEQILLKQYIKEKLYLNYRCPIYVNGELINPIEDVVFINGGRLNYLTSIPVIININEHGYSVDDSGIGMDFKDAHTKLLIPHRGKDLPKAGQLTEQKISEQVKIFYRPQRAVKNNEEVTSFLHIQTAGVIIESFKVKGCAIPENLVIELPASADLTEDRQHIQLTPQNIKAIEAAIIKITGRPIQNQVELINGVAQLLENLNKRDEHAARLLQYMANQMRVWKQEKEKSSPNRFIYLPNRKDFFEIAIPEDREAVYINNSVLPFDPKGFPGAVMARSWQSAAYSLWVLPFNASSEKISFVLDNVIIINKEHYGLHANNPAALDLEVNPIVTGYEPNGFIPQPKGRLLPENGDAVIAMAIAQKQEGIEKIGLPDAVKHEIESLGLSPDIMGKLIAKLNRFFANLGPNIKIQDLINWLKRLNKFNTAFSSEADVLNMIINSSGIGPLPSKNYTRVKSTHEIKNPKLISPNSSVQLPNGNLAVISSAYNSITIINPDTGETIKHFKIKGLNMPRSMTAINGNLAVTSFIDSSITIINPDTGETIKHFKIKELKKVTGITAINGNLAICSFDGNYITIINPDTGRIINYFDNTKIKELNGPTGITAINGNLAVCNVGDNSITIIDPDTGKVINHFEIKGLKNPKGITAISGNLALTSFLDNSITIVNSDTGKVINHFEIKGLKEPRGITAINGNLAVVNVGDNPVIIIEFEEFILSKDYANIKSMRKLEKSKLRRAISITLLPNGNLAVCNTERNYIAIIDSTTGETIKHFKIKESNPISGITAINGNLAVTSFLDNSITIIDPDAGKIINHFEIKGLTKPKGITAINGNLAVCSFDDNSITIIDPDAGKIINHFEIKELKESRGMTAINGNLAVTGFLDNFITITIIDPDTGEVISHFKIKEPDEAINHFENVLKNPRGLTAINGNLAVTSFLDNSITIIDPDTGEVINHFDDTKIKELKEPMGLTAINGDLVVVNFFFDRIIIIEFGDIKQDISVISEEDAQLNERFQQFQRFLDANSIFFDQNPDYKANYLSNLFYLKAHLKNISQEKLNLYLAFLDQNSLALLDLDTIDTLNEKLSKFNIKDIQMFFSFLLDIDTVTIGRVSFNSFLERWFDLFNYLNKPNIEEARKIFFGSISSSRGFLAVDFDMGSVTNEFLKMAYLLLRGDIENILSFEDRVDIQGELAYELKDVPLEAVNAVSDRFPIEAFSELRSYKAFLDEVKDEVLLDIAGDIEKSIYGQDKSENLFIRENAQNARDAILTERMAVSLVKVYYSAFPEDADIDGVKLEALIPQDVKDKFRSALIKRIRILDALIAIKLEEEPERLRKDIIIQLIEEYKSACIEIRSYIQKDTNQWIFSIEDPVGMDLATIIGPLLVLDESTKLGSLISEGILGLGFYTNLVDADALRITTGIGNSLFYELMITHKDNIGWAIESFKELKGQYKGTRIERIKYFNQDKLPGLDAAFVNYSTYRYVSAIQDVDIYCNSRRINEELNLSAEIKTLYGPIRFYENNSRYQRLARSLLYVEYPKSEEYFSLVPEHFLKLIRQRGFTIDLSHMIPLVRTRLTISQKEKYLLVIQKAVAAACLKTMVKLFYDEGLFPPGLSEDYFEDKNNQDEQGVFPGIKEDAVNINQHSLDKVDFERYLIKDSDDELTKEEKNRSLKYLLTLIEAEDKAGNMFSLRGIKEEFLQLMDNGVEDMAIVKERIRLEHASLDFMGYIESALNLAVSKKYSASKPSRRYPEKQIKGSKELSDFKAFCKILFKYTGLGNIEIGFYEKEESRLADFGDNALIWNLYHAQRYVKELQEILKGDKNPMKIWDFFHEILDAATHELTHFYDIGKASHESMEGLTGLFAWKQKELIRNFINSKKSWDDIMNELAKKRSFAKQSIIPKKPAVNTSL